MSSTGSIPGQQLHRRQIPGLGASDREINGRVAEDWEWAIRLRVYEQERVKDAALVATVGKYVCPLRAVELVQALGPMPWETP